MLLGFSYEVARAALAEAKSSNPESIPDPQAGNSTHDLWSAAMLAGTFVVYVPEERFREAPEISPETTDGIYSIVGRRMYPGGHFVYVEGGRVLDPADGSVTPWCEYASAHAVRVRSVLYARA